MHDKIKAIKEKMGCHKSQRLLCHYAFLGLGWKSLNVGFGLTVMSSGSGWLVGLSSGVIFEGLSSLSQGHPETTVASEIKTSTIRIDFKSFLPITITPKLTK
jgi:hypothetical protein